MEYIIIALLGVILILLLINLFRNNGSKDIIERMGRLDTSLTKDIGDFKLTFSKDLRGDFDALELKIENKLTQINDKVNQELNDNFEQDMMIVNNELQQIEQDMSYLDDIDSLIIELRRIKEELGTL